MDGRQIARLGTESSRFVNAVAEVYTAVQHKARVCVKQRTVLSFSVISVSYQCISGDMTLFRIKHRFLTGNQVA